MVRRKHDITDETPLEDGEQKPVVEPEVAPVEEEVVTLRLKQNEFVFGELRKEGSTFQFTKTEAARRLKTQTFWAIA